MRDLAGGCNQVAAHARSDRGVKGQTGEPLGPVWGCQGSVEAGTAGCARVTPRSAQALLSLLKGSATGTANGLGVRGDPGAVCSFSDSSSWGLTVEHAGFGGVFLIGADLQPKHVGGATALTGGRSGAGSRRGRGRRFSAWCRTRRGCGRCRRRARPPPGRPLPWPRARPSRSRRCRRPCHSGMRRATSVLSWSLPSAGTARTPTAPGAGAAASSPAGGRARPRRPADPRRGRRSARPAAARAPAAGPGSPG